MIHIGALIKQELQRQERSVTWFANKLCCERTNIYSIFKRESIDTALLLRISSILHHNFFVYYNEELEKCEFSSTRAWFIFTYNPPKVSLLSSNFAPTKSKFMKHFVLAVITIIAFCACASSIPINLLCDEQHVEIYVDGEYIGRGLVHHIVPKGNDYINVSCRENGIEIYSRRFYVKGGKNQLYELRIPKDYRYSSGQQIKSTTRR